MSVEYSSHNIPGKERQELEAFIRSKDADIKLTTSENARGNKNWTPPKPSHELKKKYHDYSNETNKETPAKPPKKQVKPVGTSSYRKKLAMANISYREEILGLSPTTKTMQKKITNIESRALKFSHEKVLSNNVVIDKDTIKHADANITAADDDYEEDKTPSWKKHLQKVILVETTEDKGSPALMKVSSEITNQNNNNQQIQETNEVEVPAKEEYIDKELCGNKKKLSEEGKEASEKTSIEIIDDAECEFITDTGSDDNKSSSFKKWDSIKNFLSRKKEEKKVKLREKLEKLELLSKSFRNRKKKPDDFSKETEGFQNIPKPQDAEDDESSYEILPKDSLEMKGQCMKNQTNKAKDESWTEVSIPKLNRGSWKPNTRTENSNVHDIMYGAKHAGKASPESIAKLNSGSHGHMEKPSPPRCSIVSGSEAN